MWGKKLHLSAAQSSIIKNFRRVIFQSDDSTDDVDKVDDGDVSVFTKIMPNLLLLHFLFLFPASTLKSFDVATPASLSTAFFENSIKGKSREVKTKTKSNS